jgi:hypothetical protein
MNTLQAFVLGVMVACTPSMMFLARKLWWPPVIGCDEGRPAASDG